MGCLLALLTGFFPRLGLLIVWIFLLDLSSYGSGAAARRRGD